jgi:type VI protein secretion system component Hcp
MSRTRGLRAVVAMATVAGAVLVAPRADAGSYLFDAHIDGCPNGGNFTPTSFHWNDMGEVSFTHVTDNGSATLLSLAQDRRDLGSAVLHQTIQGTAQITLVMEKVHVEAVREEGGSNGPEETIVLRFNKLTYTFQPLLPNSGTKNGPAVTYVWTRR